MARMWLVAGSLLGFLGVVAGAFGAHALKDSVPPEMLEAFKTGTLYQMFHALALLVLGLWARSHGDAQTRIAGYSFIFGIVAFSFSLYAMALTGIRELGMITPIGGVLFLIGWLSFARLFFKVSPR